MCLSTTCETKKDWGKPKGKKGKAAAKSEEKVVEVVLKETPAKIKKGKSGEK